MYGGSAADHRLPTALFLLLVASCAPRFPSRRAAITIGAAAISVLVVRMALIELVWHRANRVYSADLAGIDMLPWGAKLAVAYPASAVNFAPIPETHFAALAIIAREAFVPILFALPAQQPVVLRPPYAALAKEAQPERLWNAFLGGNSSELASAVATLQQYDYLAFTNNRPVRVPSNRCLAPVFEQPTFQIFTVIHAASCSNAED